MPRSGQREGSTIPEAWNAENALLRSRLQQVTAISAPPQENLDFCVGELGRRLVKRADHLDNPAVHHLYSMSVRDPQTLTGRSESQRQVRRSRKTENEDHR